MNLKSKLTLLVIALLSMQMIAQDSRTVTGTVTDADNLPIPGANVIVVNTTTGATTDFDGNYSISVADGKSLQFSYVGYSTQVVAISGQQTLNISLVEDAARLDEVVVVGYGTRKKSHLTGAVAKIGGDDIAAIQANRVDDALAGKLPGVLIQNQS